MNLESIKIIKEKYYFLIDSLYINALKDGLSSIQKDNLIDTMLKCFPYTDRPFSYFKATGNFFLVKEFRGIPEDNQIDLNHLASDTGLLLIVEESIILNVIDRFDYDTLLDSEIDTFNLGYWQGLLESFKHGQLGLMSPVGPDPEYGGGGIFKVTLEVMVDEI